MANTPVVVLDDTLTDIADAIRSKNGSQSTYLPSEMATAISNISGSSSLWCSGNNPTLFETYTLTVNLANDTTFNSTTPSSTAQSVFAAAQSNLKQYSSALDVANYDYVIVEDYILSVAYTTTPSDPHINNSCGTLIAVRTVDFSSGANINGTPSDYGNTSHSSRQTSYTSSGVMRAGGASLQYGIYTTASQEAGIYVIDGATKVSMPNRGISIRTSSSYMTATAFNAVDAQHTTLQQRWRIYRIDKGTHSDQVAINRCTDMARTGTLPA